MKQHGLTLPELIIVLSVTAILLGFGLPGFSNQLESTQARTSTLQLLESINHARTLAISQGRRATLRHTGDWTQGWELFMDENNNSLLDEGEVLVSQGSPLKGVRVHANQPVRHYVSYIPSGESRHASQHHDGAFMAGTFILCPERPGSGYRIILARSGRARMDVANAEECADAGS